MVRGEKMNSNLGPGISYFWEGHVVQVEIIEGLGSILELELCLRSHCSYAESELKNKLCNANLKQGLFL